MFVDWLILAKWHAVSFTGFLTSLILVQWTSASAFPESDNEKLPFFNPTPNNVSFNTGETAILRCSVMNADSKFVVWKRTSEPNPISVGDYIYSPDNRYNISRIRDKYEWNLIINNVQLSDAGVYRCAIASRKKLMRHVLLRVTKSLGKIEVEPQEDQPTTIGPDVVITGRKFYTKGETIELQCTVTGSVVVPSEIDWFKSGAKLIRNNRIEVNIRQSIKHRTLMSKISIPRSTMKDAGVYVCRSTDLDIKSLRIHVLDDRDAGEIVKRVSGTNGGKNHCCVIFSVNFLGLVISVFTINYLHKRLLDV